VVTKESLFLCRRAQFAWPTLVGAAVMAVVLVAAVVMLGNRTPRRVSAPVATTVAAHPQRRVDTYRLVNAYPHDPEAYTQGLVFVDGFLYESTGLNGRSTLRKVDLKTGTVVERIALDEKHFAEGLAAWGDALIQLTWRGGVAFVYDRATFRLERTMGYSGEGWGLTSDASTLFLSDGSSTLRALDPVSFTERRRLVVRDNGVEVRDLNELEVVEGEIFANVWHTDRIARIDPQSGDVRGWINLEGLLPERRRADPEAVLNGIAWDRAGRRLFVTGKLWPTLFEIQVVPR
jgi:glutaminyl-peptide cyclotransferase